MFKASLATSTADTSKEAQRWFVVCGTFKYLKFGCLLAGRMHAAAAWKNWVNQTTTAASNGRKNNENKLIRDLMPSGFILMLPIRSRKINKSRDGRMAGWTF